MVNLVDLTDRRILVTGGSSGIGKATAILLSQLGAKVILVARRENLLQEAIGQLEGEGHAYYAADLTQLDDIAALVKKIVEEQGKLDGLVHAAGITLDLPMTTYSPEKVENIFKINYFSFFELVRQATKKNRFNPGMRIVGLSSIAAFLGNRAQTQYTASKAAMNAAIRCMANELSDKGICINTIAPGMVNTQMYGNYLQRYGGEASDVNTRLLGRQYLGIIEPVHIGNAIAFLLSPAAKYITGITLTVGGGLIP